MPLLAARAILLAAGAIALAAPRAAAQTGAPAADANQIQREIDDAWNAGKWAHVESLLTAAWKSDADWAREACFRLATGEIPHARPLGAVMLGRNGTVAEIASAARSLDRVRFPDERRFLVRSIGTRAAKEEDKQPALDAIKAFLADQDFLVRAAAADSLADLNRPGDLAVLTADLREPPAYKNADTVDEREIFNRACYGAVRTVIGLRARARNDVVHWLADGEPKRAEPVSTEKTPSPGNWNGQTFYSTPCFDIYFRIAGLKGAPLDGPLAWPALPATVEGSALAASRAMEHVLGGFPHEPVIRLYLCDAREFTARAGVTFFQGVTKSNEIVVKVEPAAALPGTLTHEYVHYIHENSYKDQPRWISEGLAMSLSESPKQSAWKTRRPAGETAKMVERGIFSELVNWNASGSSDAKEGARYSLSHIAIDYLRFGGYAVPEERLGFLMGRLSRRESATRAIEYTYGLGIKDLDRRAAQWLAAP